MFVMVYFSQPRPAARPDFERQSATTNEPRPGITLQGDSSLEVVPPTRIRIDRALSVGSLQITLTFSGKEEDVGIQLEPVGEIEHFWSQEWFDKRMADTVGNGRISNWVTLGRDIHFAFRGRVYRLDLLEIQEPMTGLNRRPIREWFDLHAVIRLLDVGAYALCGEILGTTSGPAAIVQRESRKGRTLRYTVGRGSAPDRLLGC